MQHKKLIFLFCLVLLFVTSCKKDLHLLTSEFDKGLPEVRIESLEWHDDTLVVTSRVISEGITPLVFAGLCFAQDSIPDLLDNQVLADPINGLYTISLSGFTPYDTYIFRPIGGNDYGYAFGDTVVVTVPYPGPPEVPCALPENTIYLSSIGYDVTSVYTPPFSTYGEYEIDAGTAGGPEYHFYFNNQPMNGIYTTNTVSGFENNSAQVFVELNTGFEMYSIIPGGKVYVVENSDGTFTVTFCELKFYISSGLVKIKGSFDVD